MMLENGASTVGAGKVVEIKEERAAVWKWFCLMLA